MEKVYEVQRIIKGRQVTDYAMLSYYHNCNISRTLHDLGLEYCRTRGRDLYDREGGLTLARLLEHVPPELFAKYGITLTWLSEKAIPADQETKVVGPYEVETYLDARSDYNDKFRRIPLGLQTAAKLCDRSCRQFCRNLAAEIVHIRGDRAVSLAVGPVAEWAAEGALQASTSFGGQTCSRLIGRCLLYINSR